MVSDPAGRSVVAANPRMPPANIAGCSSVSTPLEFAHLQPSNSSDTYPCMMLSQSQKGWTTFKRVGLCRRFVGQQGMKELHEELLKRARTPVQSIFFVTASSKILCTRTRNCLISILLVELVQHLEVLRVAAHRSQACGRCCMHSEKL